MVFIFDNVIGIVIRGRGIFIIMSSIIICFDIGLDGCYVGFIYDNLFSNVFYC